MNKEIKEILDFFKDKDDYIEDYGYEYKRISLEETKILLDYITNLQEELELSHQDNLELLDYKSRNEKAIKFIEQKFLPSHSIKNTDWEFEEVIYSDLPVEAIKPLVDILQGVDKE